MLDAADIEPLLAEPHAFAFLPDAVARRHPHIVEGLRAHGAGAGEFFGQRAGRCDRTLATTGRTTSRGRMRPHEYPSRASASTATTVAASVALLVPLAGPAQADRSQGAPAQQPSGAYLDAGPADNPETRWYHELAILHAAASYAVAAEDRHVLELLTRQAAIRNKWHLLVG